ncbi:DUF397 domain-containing protein [Streptomyces tagetis]|uniref:DUF397 domain-containing protein n=1 Tax=Streptomyces tagetis TaxID=2820809 RepID=A0A940XQR6_9ACTN|nr:DUF397 domain-containing protein [Streptomyces sp. RG38]MBQ0829064.1 DUF397 domain-containing protein [Streptomyces sp. RG38]
MPPTPSPTSSLKWFKSTHSGGNITECVECAYATFHALIRESKRKDGPIVTVRTDTWAHFVGAVRRDQLNKTGGRGKAV